MDQDKCRTSPNSTMEVKLGVPSVRHSDGGSVSPPLERLVLRSSRVLTFRLVLNVLLGHHNATIS